MSNAFYCARGERTEAVLEQLIQNYNLEKSYQSRKEIIYRGDQMLVALAKKYLFLYIYDEQDVSLRKKIQKSFCCEVSRK